MERTGIVRNPVFLRHDMGSYHPESPRRLEVIYAMLDEHGRELGVKEIPARQASVEEISTNHSRSYVESIASTAGLAHTFLDPDTCTSADSWDAASIAVGGLLNLVDAVVEGEILNGFALVRPPGHHAEWDRAMGFCLFNNVAVAARHALKRHGMERIAVVDWDLHHGNGTQHSFYDDPQVLFISAHQYPYYPGTGAVRETGRGKGKGFTVNIPLGVGAGDQEYEAIFKALVAPILKSYKPELILVSAGFDAHHTDPLGGMSLTEQGYEKLLRILMRSAAEECSGRVVLTLEGGYNTRALVESVRLLLRSLSSYDPERATDPEPRLAEPYQPNVIKWLNGMLAPHRAHWPDLPSI